MKKILTALSDNGRRVALTLLVVATALFPLGQGCFPQGSSQTEQSIK